MDQAHVEKLKDIARDVRVLALSSMGHLGVGHVGGAMSVVDILTYLYYTEMHIDPKNPRDEQRDRLVLSKGHAGPALYAVLARKGFFPIEWLDTLNVGGTHLPSHCDRNQTPGIDMTTGSLGQGLSAAVGIALAMRMDGRTRRTFAIIGDGESQEGQNWEAAMCASQYGLDNLIAFTDYNKMQIDGTISDVMELEDLSARWAAFGWHVQKIDGHDFEAIEGAIESAKQTPGKPSMIILDTIKGKGCSFAEGKLSSHNMPISHEQLNEALAALKEVK